MGRALFIAIALAAAAAALAAPRPLVVAAGTMPGGRANPHESVSITRLWLYAAIYDTLTFVDRDGKLLPWLATSWRREDDRRWTFDLRPEVKFSNGALLTAADVVATIAFLQSPAGKSEPAAAFVSGIARAVALDTTTVSLETATPDPLLPQKLSLIRIAILPDRSPLSRDRLITDAIGTGPYRIEEWSANRATLAAVTGAWRLAPTQVLQAIAIPDSQPRRNALALGTVDIAQAAFFFEDLDRPDLPYNLVIDQLPAVVGLGFNTKKDTPLRDVRVRRALSHAVDAKAIVDSLFAGRTPLAAQPARKEFIGFNPDLRQLPYDPERARALLKDAGYENGFSFTMSLTSGATVWDQIFQLIAANLAKINVKMTIILMREPAFAEQVYVKGIENEAYGTAFFSPTFDALETLRQHSCSWPVSVYCDPEAQRLIDRAQAESDLAQRTALTRDVMARTTDMAQGIFLYESVGLVGYSKRITGLRSDFGFLRYELMTVAD